MATIAITGGTRGIGKALADRLHGHDIIPIGSAHTDLSSIEKTRKLAEELKGVDVLVMGAYRFNPTRIVTDEGYEHTFALYTLSRHVLAEEVRAPLTISLCGVGGIPMGRITWDDLQLTKGYGANRATMQSARLNDLLGIDYARRHPELSYALYNPMFVDTGLHHNFGQPMRAVVKTAATLFAQTPAQAAEKLAPLVEHPPGPGLSSWRKGKRIENPKVPAGHEAGRGLPW